MITGPRDVVEALGITPVEPSDGRGSMIDDRLPVTPEQALLIEAIADGADTASALLASGELGGSGVWPCSPSLELSGSGQPLGGRAAGADPVTRLGTSRARSCSL